MRHNCSSGVNNIAAREDDHSVTEAADETSAR
jgi:hypothetical protein